MTLLKALLVALFFSSLGLGLVVFVVVKDIVVEMHRKCTFDAIDPLR